MKFCYSTELEALHGNNFCRVDLTSEYLPIVCEAHRVLQIRCSIAACQSQRELGDAICPASTEELQKSASPLLQAQMPRLLRSWGLPSFFWWRDWSVGVIRSCECFWFEYERDSAGRTFIVAAAIPARAHYISKTTHGNFKTAIVTWTILMGGFHPSTPPMTICMPGACIWAGFSHLDSHTKRCIQQGQRYHLISLRNVGKWWVLMALPHSYWLHP